MQRRRFLELCAAVAAGSPVRVAADTPRSDDLESHDLTLSGDRRIARRTLVLVPKHADPGTKLPLLILLHGLGETGNERLGIHAWGERYGLVRAYERLRRPPIVPTLRNAGYLEDERRRELDAALAARPFRGMVLACPVTPNPHKLQPAARTLDRYADWIESTLVPAVRATTPLVGPDAAIGLDGCSLGGYVGIEVFLRKTELFASFGGVQSAFSVPGAIAYADRLARALERVGARPIHVETSSRDPYRRANQALSKRLRALGVDHELRVPPGPHDQPWLREIGTLEMLLFHDRALSGA